MSCKGPGIDYWDVTESRKYCDVLSSSDSCSRMHWLPICAIRPITVTFKTRSTSTLAFLHSLRRSYVVLRTLRSVSTGRLMVPRTIIKLVECLFSVTATTALQLHHCWHYEKTFKTYPSTAPIAYICMRTRHLSVRRTTAQINKHDFCVGLLIP